MSTTPLLVTIPAPLICVQPESNVMPPVVRAAEKLITPSTELLFPATLVARPSAPSTTKLATSVPSTHTPGTAVPGVAELAHGGVTLSQVPSAKFGAVNKPAPAPLLSQNTFAAVAVEVV